jgi:hypothetical protein
MPDDELWVDSYATVPELRAFARANGVELPSRASKLEVVKAIRAADLEPPRWSLTRWRP